jgi:hypothetical protein
MLICAWMPTFVVDFDGKPPINGNQNPPRLPENGGHRSAG